MAFTYSGSPINISQGGFPYDPYAQYIYAGATVNDMPNTYNPFSQAAYRSTLASSPANPFNQAAASSTQSNDLATKLLGSLNLGGGGGTSGGGLFGLAGTGSGFDPSTFDLSSFLNLFDVNDERARTGLRDQFTMAGGAENLGGPWSDASSQLERGLGLQRGGHIVDLISRLTAPQVSAQSAQLQALVTLLSQLLG